jgi:hypothetical protein
MTLVETLSNKVFPGDAKERNMATYSAYFDESTNEKSPIFVVAGFLSTDAHWGLFETDWKEVLAEFGISSFHMQHFAQKKEEFTGWSESRRQAILRKLLGIITHRAKLGFAAVVHSNDFDQIFVGAAKQKMDSVYNLACTACHLQVGEWAKKNYQVEPVAYFFDAGHEDAHEVAKTFLETKNHPEKC